jgi:hypothetical protein
MTLMGMKKHVGVLEQAGLVATEKVGRVRTCKLGPRTRECSGKCSTARRRAVPRSARPIWSGWPKPNVRPIRFHDLQHRSSAWVLDSRTHIE